MNNLSAVPAYGRSYENQNAMLDDWRNGKDFRIVGTGTYFSIRDVDALAHNLHYDAISFWSGDVFALVAL
jgi:hypothetical protein